jgi:hypothetical protein
MASRGDAERLTGLSQPLAAVAEVLPDWIGSSRMRQNPLGEVSSLPADNGHFSEGNVNACVAAGIEPVIAMGREAHHHSLEER